MKKLIVIYLSLALLLLGCRMPSRVFFSNIKTLLHGGVHFFWVSKNNHPEVYESLMNSSKADKGKKQKSVEVVILDPKIKKASITHRELVPNIFGPNQVTIGHRHYTVGNHEFPVIIDSDHFYFPYYQNWDLYSTQLDSIYVVEYSY